MKKAFTILSTVAALITGLIYTTTACARTDNGNNIHGKPHLAAARMLKPAPVFTPAKGKTQSVAGPLSFIENVGQVTDQDHQPRHDIQFRIAATGGLNIFIGDGAIHYQFSRPVNEVKAPSIEDMMKPGYKPTPVDYDMYRMDVELQGANKKARLVTEQLQDYYENYFTQATGDKGIVARTYRRIIYKGIYPNIDWVLYIKGDRLEHEFVVHPGGKVSDIQLKYGGASGLKINSDGSLLAGTPQGNITEDAPYAYQEDGRQVACEFKLDKGILSYKAATHKGELVIDPTLSWATYYGGPGNGLNPGDNQAYGIATDGSGNVYITGFTNSTTGIATSGAYQTTIGGVFNTNAFLAKFSSGGAIQWATYYGGGGSGTDLHGGVAIDGFGNVYITGGTYSSSGIATSGAYQTALVGSEDAFLAKFNSVGAIQWATYYGSGGSAYGVATDGFGKVYITGVGGGLFLAQFSSAGALQWATSGSGNGTGVATDGSGNVYITGNTGSSTGIATSGAYQTTLVGAQDVFLARFSSSGTLQWGTYYGGSGSNNGSGVATDGAGNVYIAGTTTSSTGIATSGTYQTALAGSQNAFLAKFSSTGAIQWGTYYGGAAGGANSNYGYGVAADGSGNVYMTGTTESSIGIATSGAYQTTLAGTYDAFLAQFSSAGAIQWATYYGGSGGSGAGVNQAYGIATNGSGNVYMTGYTESSIGIATNGTTYVPNADAFVADFSFNYTLTFNGGSPQSLTVCESSGSKPINSLLTVTDGGVGLTETYSVTVAPLHGVITAGSTVTSGASVSPTGWAYTPTAGYTGTDAFTIKVSDGTHTASTLINVIVSAPPTISGGSNVTICAATTTTLTATGGATYTWSPGTGLSATTGAKVIANPASTTTYTVTGTSAAGCSNTATVTVTVNPLPNTPITGTPVVCVAATTPLSDASPGGAWSSGNTAVATINTTGVLSGVSQGTVSISYIVTNSCGTATTTVTATVNPLPNAGTISGTAVVCVNATTPLSDGSPGGVWSSGNTGVATINTTGVLSGVSQGTVLISYTVTNSCGTATTTVTATVNPLPNAGTITGTPVVCIGATTPLTDASAGGVWSSGNTGVATVNATGVLSGVSQGPVPISYTVTNSCGTATTTVTATVNPLPNAGSISGTTVVCVNATTPLSDGSPGGVWSSGNTAVATINATGVLSGVSQGTVPISYTVTNSCGTATTTVTATVNPLPNAGTISGTAVVCVNATTPLSDASPGGVWSSGNTAVATINTTGVLSGVSQGTVLISYTVANSCGTATTTITATVNPLPNAGTISGTAVVCVNATTQLSDGSPGGIWSSGNAGVATINATGVLSGVSQGTVPISYTVTNSCGTATTTVTATVNPLPNAGTITGTPVVCMGATIPLTDASAGGVWSSGNTGVATINATGVLSGLSQGTVPISYTVTNSCGIATTTVTATVNPLPNAGTISGTTVVCVNATTPLSDGSSGGVWSSGNTAVATINATGVLSGVSHGTVPISYTVTNSCGTATTTVTATVNPLPNAGTITGTPVICMGATTPLTDVSAGGVWRSGNTGVATINATGVLGGVLQGTASISYTVTNSCGTATTTVTATVNPLPIAGVITGTVVVCVNATTPLTDASPGGVWSSSNTGVATIGINGSVTGVSPGTAPISYTVTNSCGTAIATATVTVNPLPAVTAISGITTVCVAATTLLSDGVPGGIWESGVTGVATIDATGLVTGVTAGTTPIRYTYTNSCGDAFTTATVTVNPPPITPAAITGTTTVCAAGATTSLSDITPGGIWSSTNTAAATVDITGKVTGVTAGTSTISYTYTNSCGSIAAITTVTVNPLPGVAAITGVAFVCAGLSSPLSDITTGGVWSSTNTSIATVSATGVVAGVIAGTSIISYTVTNGCGSIAATTTFTVDPQPTVPAAITGATAVCAGGAVAAISDVTAGGVWSTVNTTIATVGVSGIVTGVTAGTAAITYTYINSCGSRAVTASVTVNPLPDAGTVTGITSFCTGASTILSDLVSGGTWSSGNTSIATVGASGLVTSVSVGPATISYAVTNGCGTAIATATVTVNPPPSAGAISGLAAVCVGANIALTDFATGGAWSATNINATVSTGMVTGAIPGTDTIMYIATGACGSDTAMKIITINPLPDAGSISGAASVCAGANITLSDAITGGTWSAANTNAAVIAGSVTGTISGTDTIYYMVTNVCGTDTARKTITIDPLPGTGTITGAGNVCAGSQIILSDSAAGGVWSAANTTASVTGGIVTGNSAGTDTVSYSVTNSCGTSAATAIITVNPLPAAGAIAGNSAVCIGSAINLSDDQPGGIWSSSDIFATVNSAGLVTGNAAGADTIVYTLTNSSSCINKAIHVVTVNALPGAGTISGLQSVCEGAKYNLTETAGGGKWHSGNTSLATIDSLSGSIKALAPGVVTITYTTAANAAGCTNATTYNITILSVAPFSIDSNVSEVKCPGTSTGSITITVNDGTGPYQYTWAGGDTTAAINNLPSGTYSVAVKDLSTQCSLIGSFTLPEPDSMQITPDVKSDFCKAGNGSISVTVSGGTSPYTYLWSNNATTGQVAGLQADTYTVTVTDANTCATTLPVTVNEGACNGVVIRTGVSPNGDGVNDNWVIEGITDFPDNSVQIFDKWGDIVYEKKNYANDWGGIGKDGKLLPDGTYFYLVKLNAPNVAGGNGAMTGAILIKR